MDKKMIDSIKVQMPKINFKPHTLSLPDYSKIFEDSYPQIMNIDPERMPPNRTAKNTEQTVEILKIIAEASEKESKIQRKRFIITTVLTVLVLFIAIVGIILQICG